MRFTFYKFNRNLYFCSNHYFICIMFSFFKPKPQLKQLLDNSYIDIHSHILPGIDDGSKNNADSELLLNGMIAMGFKKSITTPHTIKNSWDNTKESITATTRQLYTDFPQQTNRLQLQCASEYYLDDHFVSQFQSEDLLTLKNKHVLVEMSYMNAPLQLFDILFELQVKGYTPVLAHPERYSFYHENFQAYHQLKKAGCLFQMNLLSSVGYYGDAVMQTANELLKNKLIDFVGSDMHHKGHLNAFDSKVRISCIKELKTAIANNVFFD